MSQKISDLRLDLVMKINPESSGPTNKETTTNCGCALPFSEMVRFRSNFVSTW